MRDFLSRSPSAGRRIAAAAAVVGAALLGYALMQPTKGADIPGWEPVNEAMAEVLAAEGRESGSPGGASKGAAQAAAVSPAGPAAASAPSAAPPGTEGPGTPEAPDEAAQAASEAPEASAAAKTGQAAASGPASNTGPATVPGQASALAGATASPAAPAAKPDSAASGLLDLNAATEDQLDELPGIGPAKARAIVEYRKTRGAFRSVEELKNVKGIGEKLFAKIRNLVTVASS